MEKTKKIIFVDEIGVPIALMRRKGHRSFTLSVHAGGRVTVTVPKMTSEKEVLRYIIQKKKWLQDAIQKAPPSNVLTEKNPHHYKTYKDKARQFVLTRLEELNKQYGFVYRKIFIRANTSRWGSCSDRGNLNFDYRILFLPGRVQDYLLVHELCHLKEMNHSKRFWNLVAQAVPDHARLRGELREQQPRSDNVRIS